jgi:hypothetical protein
VFPRSYPGGNGSSPHNRAESLRSCGGVAVFRYRWDNAGPLLLAGRGWMIVRESYTSRRWMPTWNVDERSGGRPGHSVKVDLVVRFQ